jgi:hypothetical protein
MDNPAQKDNRIIHLWPLVVVGLVAIGLAITLAWISNEFEGVQFWGQFLVVILVAVGFMCGAWWAVKADKSLELPSWLAWLILGAAFIRLAAGVLWFTGLPNWGYGSEVELGGYIMADAHARDTAAWELAQSDVPLFSTIGDYRQVDQYGGMLFLSGSIYRYLGGEHHQPLLVVAITVSISSLAVLFGWAFTARLWGNKAARVTAWIVAFFPDAIILGSSQMREAFLMTLVTAAIYGLVRYLQDRSKVGLVWLVVSLLLMLPFSPPIAGIFLLMIIILAISMDGWQLFRQTRFWAILAGVAIVAGIGIWLAWEQIAPEGISNPFALAAWWLQESARWQAYFVKRSSQLIRRIINTTPDWVNTPILIGYGVLQPFLPGALLDQGLPIWKGIAIWRSVGWTLMLPFLLVSPLLIIKSQEKRKLVVGLVLVVWMGILIAAFRSGGDLWDNPRYRVVFIGLQAGLVAWVWFSQKDSKNPWLWRVIIGLAIILAWFIPWYLQRSDQIIWPVDNVFVTLALGLVSVAVVFLVLFIWGRMKRNNRSG